MVILDFGKLLDNDDSPAIFHVPKGLIKADSIVEVIIKRARVDTGPKAILVALRPFEREKYQKKITLGEVEISRMFGFNMKYSNLSKMFFDRFVEEKRRKEPPVRL